MKKRNEFKKALAGLLFMSSAIALAACVTSEPQATETVADIESATETKSIVRGKPDDAFLIEQPEQKYIVRYAHIYDTTDDGVVYEDDNGNLWEVADPPEISGEVRLLFDSKETALESDDEIIDITEAK